MATIDEVIQAAMILGSALLPLRTNFPPIFEAPARCMAGALNGLACHLKVR